MQQIFFFHLDCGAVNPRKYLDNCRRSDPRDLISGFGNQSADRKIERERDNSSIYTSSSAVCGWIPLSNTRPLVAKVTFLVLLVMGVVMVSSHKLTSLAVVPLYVVQSVYIFPSV